jgi:hypothetical protein
VSDLYLAIDPGLATGICCIQWVRGSEPVLLWSAELTMDEFAPSVRGVLAKYPDINVICERFVINQQTIKKSQAPYSLELIGVLRQCLRDIERAGDDFKFQAPSDAMNLFPNPALKKLGYWHKGGHGHALDAIRHGLLAVTTAGWPPKRLLD